MKKKLFAIAMAVLMLGCALLTGCNTGTGIVEDDLRRPLTITIYGITGDETTKEAIGKVQNEINEITKQFFSTQIVLRFYSESEYNTVIENLVADIALEEAEKADAEAASESAAKESKRISAIDKLIAQDKATVTTRTRYVTAETEEVTTVETFVTEANIFGEMEEGYPQATDTQVDIFLICGTENLNKYVTDETYATDGESFLVALDEELKFAAKSLNQYLNPTILLAGKVNNATYAIPTNKRIAEESTYLVLDKALVKECGTNADSIRALTSKELIGYMQTIVDKNNADGDKSNDIVPMLSEPDAPGIVGLFNENTIFGTYVANTAVAGFKSVPKNLLSAYQYTDHFIYMQQYKRNGYLWDNVPEGTRWGAAVITGDEDTMAQYDEDKYIVKILEKAMATTESAGSYMYGISKYTKDSSRCMEIITYLNTNADFRNLFQYGVEGDNYKIDPDTGKLVRLNHNYMMDINMTGNMFIAYPEEDMELDVWEKAKTANIETIVSPYMGFLFETKDNGEVIENMKKLSADILAKLDAYDVEADLATQLADLNKQLAEYTAAEGDKSISAAKAAVDELAPLLVEAQAIIDAATEDLEQPKAELAAANAAKKPFTDAVTAAKTLVTAKQKEIDNLKAAIEAKKKANEEAAKSAETTAAPVSTEADEKKLVTLEAELVELNKDLRAAEGREYDYKKFALEKQRIFDEYELKLTAAENAYDAIKTTDAEGKEIEVGKAYKSRVSLYERLEKEHKTLLDNINALTVPNETVLKEKYDDLQAQINELIDEVAKIDEEIVSLRSAETELKAAVETARTALNTAEETLTKAEEPNAEFDKAVMIAYIDMMEVKDEVEKQQAYIDEANGVITEKEAEIAALKAAETPDATAIANAEKVIDTQKKQITEATTALNEAKGKLTGLEATYNAAVTAGKATQAPVDAAKADVDAKQAAYDTAINNEQLIYINSLNTLRTVTEAARKKLVTEFNGFSTREYSYRDSIYSKLYGAYIKTLVKECEANTDYAVFMNIGEENAENEKGVVYIYNEWYNSMYAN